MLARRLKAKIAIAVITVIALVLFNRQFAPVRSEEQAHFDSWLSGIEPKLLDGDGGGIVFDLIAGGGSTRLTVRSDTSAAHALRLLQLVREGNLLSLGAARRTADADVAPPADTVSLSVKSSGASFGALIGREALERQPQGRLMLKLCQVFADEQQPPAATAQTEG